MSRTDSYFDQRIAAYVDGQLSLEERAEIERRLASDPALAARVLSDLHVVNSLRAMQPGRAVQPSASVLAARKLERHLRRRRLLSHARAVGIAASLIGIGWVANTATQSLPFRQSADPEFIAGAREALRVAQLDSGIKQSREPTRSKVDRAADAADIALPELPATWTVTDVSVQPWNGRRSLLITARTPLLGTVTLVAAPIEGDDAVPPTPAPDGHFPTVYWQAEGMAYALMGAVGSDRLKSEADGIEVASRKRPPAKFRG